MVSKFSAFDFYLLRVPRLSTDIIHRINEFEKKEDVWTFIKNLLDDQEILDGIYIASEDLFEKLIDVKKAGYTPSLDKMLETLYKYISRMSTRSTPFGKFSGVSLGELCESINSIKLSGEYSCSYRFDMDFTAKLSKQAADNPRVQKQIVYYTNSTLYENADHFKYIDFNEDHDRRRYQWTKVVKNPLLEHILALAKSGKRFQELVELLAALGIDEKKGKQFVDQLVGIKLLISELEPSVTATTSTGTIAKLKAFDQDGFSISTLLGLERCLQTINSKGNNISSATFRENFENMHLPESKNIFQADTLVGTTSNKLSKQIIDVLAKEIEELSIINSAKIPNDLISFTRKFEGRYGDREVPLLEAIDNENGIGYGKVALGNAEDSPLVQGLGTFQTNKSDDHLLEVVQAIMNRQHKDMVKSQTPLELDYQDIEPLQVDSSGHKPKNVPFSFYLLGNLLLPKNGESKEYRFNLLAAGGASSIPLMTRFSHLDEGLEKKLRECAAWEEKHASDVVLAEVVYLPEYRVGNILTRPKLFKYEIPIIGQCAAADDFKISLDDLWVSIKEGKVVLRSKRLNKQVIPRLSSAHNFHYGMVVYRFLCDLQFQSDCLNLSWNWGELSKRPFLPRVTYKHIILSRAKWNIEKTSLHTLNGLDNRSKVLSLKERFGLPDVVLLVSGDNELLVDLRNSIGIEILLKELAKRDLSVHEYLFDDYESPVQDSLGSIYHNEILIPLKADRLVRGIKFSPSVPETVKRSFPPGSEWVFIKIYCGVGESDRVLSEHIARLKNELTCENLIEKWFFIRYQDPDPHIRLRLLLRSENRQISFQQVVERINIYLDPLLKKHIVYRIVYDTYDRELQRYGEDKIALCESIFHVDSECIFSLLPLFKQDGGNHLRWLTGMLGIDHLLKAFGLTIDERMALVVSLRDAFLLEFSGYEKLKYKLDCKYRENRNRIQHVFDPLVHSDSEIHSELFARFQSIQGLAEQIKKGYLLDGRMLNMVTSLAHMFINRLFTVKQREHEMIIYHFLVKHYCSTVKQRNNRSCELSSV